MYSNAALDYEGILMEKKKMLTVPLPSSIYDDFKIVTKSRGMKLTEVIRRFVYEEVEKARQEQAVKEAQREGRPVTKVVL